MPKYYRRFTQTGSAFFIDEQGKEVSESIARTNLVDDGSAHRTVFQEDASAADSAAAKTMAGKFVRNNNEYGPNIYQVHSVNDDGSATLHGPIGKGGTKTVSHKDLVQNHTDLGSAGDLSAVCESEKAREGMEDAFKRFGPADAKGKQRFQTTEQDTGKDEKPKNAKEKMEAAFRRPVDRLFESLPAHARPTKS